MARWIGLGALFSGAVVVSLTTGPVSAVPSGTTTSFTTQGCSTFVVPITGLVGGSLQVTATGAKGSPGDDSSFDGGGNGDGVSATLSGLTAGQVLDVCTDVGGGSAGGGGLPGGAGGGASSVALDSGGTALVVAGGGGGQGGFFGGGGGGVGSNGGNSLYEGGFAASGGVFGPGAGDGGTGATFGIGTPGTGGAGGTGTAGASPLTDSAGGGGGGGGYAGGGGGGGGGADPHSDHGGGGGGGGSDYCPNAVISGITVSSCVVTAGAGSQTSAGSGSGFAGVDLTYVLTSITVADNGPNPSVTGQNITLVATVTGSDPTGTVDFEAVLTSGPSAQHPLIDLGTAGLTGSGSSNTAAKVTNALPANPPGDPWVINALYQGDGTNPPADTESNSPQVTQVVGVLTAFAAAGCSTYTVPDGVTSLDVLAVGAAGTAGGDGTTSTAGGAGDGDQVTGVLDNLTGGQSLYVCVDEGAGLGGSGASHASQTGGGGGGGGGASGVSLGTNFSEPQVVAGGGGGGGGGSLDSGTGGNGGGAGVPTGGHGSAASLGNPGGAGGASSCALAATGPGVGGQGTNTSGSGAIAGGGGGGGGGYCGGAGGGNSGLSGSGGGGGGGSDFCNGIDFTGCTVGSGAGTQATAGSSAGDAEVVLVPLQQVTPTLSTTASSSVAAGTSISDSASLSSGAAPGGTMTFALYGPSGTVSCTAADLVSTGLTPVTVSGNGTYSSGSYVATTAGTYYWVATYSGDTENASVGGSCGDAGESVSVTKAGPTLSTTASSSVAAGNSISDSASLSGGSGPGGTISFALYGPSGIVSCTAADLVSTGLSPVTVSGNGSYSSGSYVATTAGTYYWVATYSGDDNNTTIGGSCADSGESVVVTKTGPVLRTTASGTTVVTGSISDSAVLAGALNPTGTITFNLYGPSASPVCTASDLVGSATTTDTVSGNGTYASHAYVTNAVGTYYWVATYSGDTNNKAVGGTCGDAGESSVVTKASPSLTTQASASVADGGSIYDSAGLASGRRYGAAGQSMTFTLYGPNGCSGSPLFTNTQSVSTLGGAVSASYVTKAAGTYSWAVSFSGDAFNQPTSEPCGSAGESTTVTATLSPTGASLSGQVCKPFTQTFSAGSGYSYAMSTSAPAGLSFNGATGVLSGTPTAAGTTSFTVTATKAGQPSVSHAYVLVISSGSCIVIDAGSTMLPNGVHGHGYSTALYASGGTAPYRFQIQSGGLPTGLSLSSAGSISGTPTQAGTYSVTIEAFDSANPQHSGSATLTIIIT